MSFNPDSLKSITASGNDSGPIADEFDGVGGLMAIPNYDDSQESIDEMMEMLYESLLAMTEDSNLADSISVTEGDGKVYVTFNQTTFFDGDSYQLRSESLPILDTICELLTGAQNAIDEVRILGHTAQEYPDSPNDPRIDRFLASNRATNVLVYIQEHSEVDPARLISEGYGQHRPVASNDTAEGRAQNRRVEMIISGRNLAEEIGSGLQHYSTSTESMEDAQSSTTESVENAQGTDTQEQEVS
jgi:chemotaxis protein MotB